MHLDGDFDAVIFSELRVPGPKRRHLFLPLPVQNVEILRRPGARDPVRMLGVVAIAGTARKVDYHRNFQLLGQPQGLSAGFLKSFGERRIGMQRISMTAQRTDRKTAVFELELELTQRSAIAEHRQRTVRVARVIAGAQFHSVDVQALQSLEDRDQRNLAQQCREDADSHRNIIIGTPSDGFRLQVRSEVTAVAWRCFAKVRHARSPSERPCDLLYRVNSALRYAIASDQSSTFSSNFARDSL